MSGEKRVRDFEKETEQPVEKKVHSTEVEEVKSEEENDAKKKRVFMEFEYLVTFTLDDGSSQRYGVNCNSDMQRKILEAGDACDAGSANGVRAMTMLDLLYTVGEMKNLDDFFKGDEKFVKEVYEGRAHLLKPVLLAKNVSVKETYPILLQGGC